VVSVWTLGALQGTVPTRVCVAVTGAELARQPVRLLELPMSSVVAHCFSSKPISVTLSSLVPSCVRGMQCNAVQARRLLLLLSRLVYSVTLQTWAICSSELQDIANSKTDLCITRSFLNCTRFQTLPGSFETFHLLFEDGPERPKHVKPYKYWIIYIVVVPRLLG
jgi:hypothetical protein